MLLRSARSKLLQQNRGIPDVGNSDACSLGAHEGRIHGLTAQLSSRAGLGIPVCGGWTTSRDDLGDGSQAAVRATVAGGIFPLGSRICFEPRSTPVGMVAGEQRFSVYWSGLFRNTASPEVVPQTILSISVSFIKYHETQCFFQTFDAATRIMSSVRRQGRGRTTVGTRVPVL